MCPAALLALFCVAAPAAPEDFDKDGVPDLDDDCPTDPGDKSARGCPGGAEEPPPPPRDPPKIEVKADRLDVKETVQFRSGSASVDPGSFALLKEIAAAIKALPPAKKLVIAGHTDDRGDKKKNEKLSAERARAVVAHLVRAGVARERLSAEGHGPNEPIASNATEAGRKQNRRVEFLIVDGP